MVNKVLVIEDNTNERLLYVKVLEPDFEVVATGSVKEAYLKLEDNKFDIYVVDLMMPEKDGLSFVRDVRALDKKTPILMVSANDSITKRIEVLDSGVDDFLLKPFDVDEFKARIKALLRRSKLNAADIISIGSLKLNRNNHELTIENEKTLLSAKEFILIEKLLTNLNVIFSRNQLYEAIYEEDKDINSNALDVLISRCKKKLVECKDIEFVTIRNIGYMVRKNEKD